PERAAPASVELALGLAPRQRVPVAVNTLAEVPEPELADAAGDGDLAAGGKDVEHQPRLPTAPPPVILAGRHQVVLEVARQQRPVPLELPQHVPAEARVRAYVVADPLVALQLAASAELRHPRALHRQLLDRVDECVVLEQLSLLPEQEVELRGVVRPEAAEEDELLRRRDRRDRVQLQEAERTDRVEHGRGRLVEQLRPHRDPPGLLRRDDAPRHASSRDSSRSRSRTTRRHTSSSIRRSRRSSSTASRSASISS